MTTPATPCIYVVDDDEYVIELLDMVLSQAGWPSRSFARAEDALEAAVLAPPAVVLLDIGLAEGIDGFEAARRFRAHPALRGIRLVAMTGLSSSRVEAEGALFDAVFTKPMHLAAIVGTLRALVPGGEGESGRVSASQRELAPQGRARAPSSFASWASRSAARPDRCSSRPQAGFPLASTAHVSNAAPVA